METRVRGRSTGHGIWKTTDSDARTPAPHLTLIRPYLRLLISLSLCKMRVLRLLRKLKWESNEVIGACSKVPEQSSQSQLVESESEWVGGREKETLEKYPLGLILVLKAILLVKKHVLCIVLTNLEVNRKVPFIFSTLKQWIEFFSMNLSAFQPKICTE